MNIRSYQKSRAQGHGLRAHIARQLQEVTQ